jgi:hypothetical protein
VDIPAAILLAAASDFGAAGQVLKNPIGVEVKVRAASDCSPCFGGLHGMLWFGQTVVASFEWSVVMVYYIWCRRELSRFGAGL